jgi:hypothetical protein
MNGENAWIFDGCWVWQSAVVYIEHLSCMSAIPVRFRVTPVQRGRWSHILGRFRRLEVLQAYALRLRIRFQHPKIVKMSNYLFVLREMNSLSRNIVTGSAWPVRRKVLYTDACVADNFNCALKTEL